MSSLPKPARGSSARTWLVGVALTISALWLCTIFDDHVPLEQWLFFRYAGCWLVAGAFCLSSLSVGNRIVRALSTPGEQLDGQITLSFATGAYVFFLATFLVGLFGGLNKTSFVLIPVVLFAVGARELARDLLSFHARRFGRPWFEPLSAAECVGLAGGTIALFLLYVPALIPENTAYDARWYHLGLAEHYAAAGAIARFPEGNVFGVIPHLATVLYAWAFLTPGATLFDQVEICAHLEFVFFLFTLGGIPVLVRYLVPGGRARMAWVALFFFPAIFLYDASLLVAADHVAALWAVPTYLMMARAFRDLRPSTCLLFSIQVSALALTKYTAPIAAIFPVLALLFRGVWLGATALRSRSAPSRTWLYGLAAALFSGLALTAPHWLKNWVWYGDPMYPILSRHFSPRPWIAEAPRWFAAYQAENWTAKGDAEAKLRAVLRAFGDYSLAIYNWPDFHGAFPIVGSLFTFGLVAVPLLRGTRRVFWLVVTVHVGLVFWALYFAHDRYLQTLVPLMAAGIAGLSILAWRTGLPARAAVVLLGGVQLVFSLDMPFWPLHKMTGKAGMALASEFFGQAYDKRFGARTRAFDALASIGEALPRGSKIVLHHEHVRLGLRHETIWDWPRFQFGISYGAEGSSREVYRLLKSYGATHVVWSPEQAYGDDSLAGELVFHSFVRHLVNVRSIRGRSVGELPRREPPRERQLVLYYGCSGGLQSGLYRVSDLAASPLTAPGFPLAPDPPPRRVWSAPGEALIDEVDRAIVDRRCAGAPALEGFERVARQGSREFLARRDLARPEPAQR